MAPKRSENGKEKATGSAEEPKEKETPAMKEETTAKHSSSKKRDQAARSTTEVRVEQGDIIVNRLIQSLNSYAAQLELCIADKTNKEAREALNKSKQTLAEHTDDFIQRPQLLSTPHGGSESLAQYRNLELTTEGLLAVRELRAAVVEDADPDTLSELHKKFREATGADTLEIRKQIEKELDEEGDSIDRAPKRNAAYFPVWKPKHYTRTRLNAEEDVSEAHTPTQIWDPEDDWEPPEIPGLSSRSAVADKIAEFLG